MRALYTLLATLALPLASLSVAWRGLRERRYWSGWAERFGRGPTRPAPEQPEKRGSVWIHAASVGEVQAARSLVAAVRVAWPDVPVVVTSGTPAGRALAREIFEFGVVARYAPYDLPWCLRGAFARLRPSVLVLMETELWPNLLAHCERAGVPVLVASARVSVRSAGRLMRFNALLQPALRNRVSVAAQSEADAQRFVVLGVPIERVQVCGNLKFDRAPTETARQQGARLRARYAPGRSMWVAGSTHAGEEPAVLAAHRALCQAQGDALLVLAPRHAPRFAAVAALLEASGMSWARYSGSRTVLTPGGMPAGAGTTPAPTVLLLDTIGELEPFYAAADLAFVGGSLVAVGGHNLLEPAALGIATVTGPHQHNAPDIARLLLAGGGLVMVRDAPELGAKLCSLMADPTARARLANAALATVATNRGALTCVLAMISALSPAQELPAAQQGSA